MSKTRKLFLATLVCMAAIALVFYRSRERDLHSVQITPPPSLSENSVSAPSVVSASAGLAIPSGSPSSPGAQGSAPEKNPVASPPAASDLREEVKHNPHEPPPSLLRFGADIGARMKDAKQNQAAATKLLGDLKICVSPPRLEESAVQTRALCIATAQELEETWPALHHDVQDLLANADADALQLAKKVR